MYGFQYQNILVSGNEFSDIGSEQHGSKIFRVIEENNKNIWREEGEMR